MKQKTKPDPLYWQKLRQKSVKKWKEDYQPKPINKRSKKRAKEEAEYSKKRLAYLDKNGVCEAGLPMCTHVATTIHHPAGRIGKLLTDENNFIALCLPCHEWVELHPKEAKELKLSKNRIA